MSFLPPKVLIVDDEPILRQTMQKALKNYGYRLFFAENGQQALDLFLEISPDLIFLDLRMPVMDGFEFLEGIERKPTDTFTVVVITGHGSDEEIKRSYDQGVHCFLRKPLNLTEIISLTDRCIKFMEMEKEQKRLMAEQEKALATIKTLQGLMPICTSCKKVRDQDNCWREIDAYLGVHTDAKLSRSYCPSCMKELFPELEPGVVWPY